MNHFGEIDYLTQIARPDVAVITNIGDAHIENLGSRAGILQAKKEIFHRMTPEGMAVLNGDDAMLRPLEGELSPQVVFCGGGPTGPLCGEGNPTAGVQGAALPGDYPEERLFGDRARVGRPHDLPGAHGLRHWGAVRHDRGGDEGGD